MNSMNMDLYSSSNWTAIMLKLLAALLLRFILPACYHFFIAVWWVPLRLARIARQQGLRGPKPTFLLGNTIQMKRLRDGAPDYISSFRHDLTVQQVLTENILWSNIYGKNHVIWMGPEPSIVVRDMRMVKDILSSKNSPSFGKAPMVKRMLEHLTGIGIALSDGDVWAHERRVIGPAFHSDKIKSFVHIMHRIAQNTADEWSQMIKDAGGAAEIDVQKSMTRLTSDVIAHTQFGSSYIKGQKIFQLIEELRELVFKHGFFLIFPKITYIPVPAFLKLRRLRKMVERSIKEIIEDRRYAVQTGKTTYGDDILGLMLNENDRIDPERKHMQLTTQQLIDECKTFFFGGHDTTAMNLTWTLLLLAHNKPWQDKARAEVVSMICKDKSLDYESVCKMKILDMILYESLRLYCPVNIIARIALRDTKVGDLFVPKGMGIWIPMVSIHLDPELWGEGVYDFNPDRFADGISKAATHPLAFLPFSHGPRNCLGQAFALQEAKIVLATILSRFSFTPSPSYKHCPQFSVTIRAKFGAPIIIQNLSSS